jgi:hypothetical protein
MTGVIIIILVAQGRKEWSTLLCTRFVKTSIEREGSYPLARRNRFVLAMLVHFAASARARGVGGVRGDI